MNRTDWTQRLHVRGTIVLKGPKRAWKSIENGPFSTHGQTNMLNGPDPSSNLPETRLRKPKGGCLGLPKDRPKALDLLEQIGKSTLQSAEALVHPQPDREGQHLTLTRRPQTPANSGKAAIRGKITLEKLHGSKETGISEAATRERGRAGRSPMRVPGRGGCSSEQGEAGHSRPPKWSFLHVRGSIVVKGPKRAWKSIENGPFSTMCQPTRRMDQKEARERTLIDQHEAENRSARAHCAGTCKSLMQAVNLTACLTHLKQSTWYISPALCIKWLTVGFTGTYSTRVRKVRIWQRRSC